MSEKTWGEHFLSTWLVGQPGGGAPGESIHKWFRGVMCACWVKAIIKHTLWKKSGVRGRMALPGSACLCDVFACCMFVGRCGEKGSPAWQVSCQCGWWLIALFKLQLCQSWNPWILIPDLLLEKWNNDEPAPFSWGLQSGLSATARS